MAGKPARFAAGALTLAGYTVFAVWFRPGIQASLPGPQAKMSYDLFVQAEVFDGTGKALFVLLVIFLALGGLLRERAHHTAVFTLALPVTRSQLVAAQLAVGLAELSLLAVLPVLLMPPLSGLLHQTWPITEGLRFAIVRALCGAFIFAISFLLSVLLRGEYTATIVTWIVLFLYIRVIDRIAHGPYFLNPMRALGGRWLWDRGANIDNPLPWTGLSILLLIAFALFASATRITQRENL